MAVRFPRTHHGAMGWMGGGTTLYLLVTAAGSTHEHYMTSSECGRARGLWLDKKPRAEKKGWPSLQSSPSEWGVGRHHAVGLCVWWWWGVSAQSPSASFLVRRLMALIPPAALNGPAGSKGNLSGWRGCWTGVGCGEKDGQRHGRRFD